MTASNNHLILNVDVDTSLVEPDMSKRKDDRYHRTHDIMQSVNPRITKTVCPMVRVFLSLREHLIGPPPQVFVLI